MQGTVMKITERCIVVLCEDGTFRNLPLPSVMPRLGDKISIPEPVQRQRYMRYLKKQWMYAASIVLLLGVVFFYNYLQQPKQSATLVAIDINPGIELVVNQQGMIDQVNLLNEEAKLLLSGKELVNQQFYQAVQWIIDQAEEHGYLDADTEKKWVWLSIVDLGNGAQSIDPKQISAQAKRYNVEVFAANKQQLEQAKDAELTLNKYIVLELAAEKGIELTPEQLRSQSILSSLQQAGVDPEALFAKPLQLSGKVQSPNESLNSSPSRAEPQNSIQDVDAEIADHRNEEGAFASSQGEQVGAGSLVDNSSVNESNGTELPTLKPIDSSNAEVREQLEADKAEIMPKANSKTEIQKLNLQVKLVDDGEIKVEYKQKDGRIEAKVERKTKQKEDKQQGQQAVTFAENVIKHLNLQDRSDRKVVVSRIISSLNVKQNEWHEIEFEVKFSNGSELEFEAVNPLKAEEEAQAKKKEQQQKEQKQKELKKKAEQEKKDQEKANKKEKEIEKEKENALEKAKKKEAEQKKEQAKKAAKKNNKDENDDDDDEDD